MHLPRELGIQPHAEPLYKIGRANNDVVERGTVLGGIEAARYVMKQLALVVLEGCLIVVGPTDCNLRRLLKHDDVLSQGFSGNAEVRVNKSTSPTDGNTNSLETTEQTVNGEEKDYN
jgi:hypothetical protein